jgi:hypothetical protein
MDFLSLPRICVFATLLAVYCFFFYQPQKPLREVSSDFPFPLQGVPDSTQPWKKGEFTFTPLASYALSGRIVSERSYWFGAESAISPLDIAVAWGKMSSAKLLNQIHVGSGDRNYVWWSNHALPLPQDEINRSMANVHLIPRDDNIWKQVKLLNKDDFVKINGFLVAVDRADGWHWRSSLSRDDTGDGACEVLWVDSVERW